MVQASLEFFLLTAGTVFAAAAFLTAPSKAGREMLEPFFGRNFAHRGLHEPDQSLPENSLQAFEEAVRLGYGVELDVRITKDGKIVVFHDDELARACGLDCRVEDLNWEELSALRLFGTQHRIPLFSEALSVIEGRGPLIVELKRGGRNEELCEKTYALIRAYSGACCVESFDPRIVAWFRRNAPGLLRGQLARHPKKLSEEAGRLNAFLVGNLLTNFMARPHFIAYGIGPKTPTVRICELFGAMKVAWTSLDPGNEAENDAVIFQYYRPKTKYK